MLGVLFQLFVPVITTDIIPGKNLMFGKIALYICRDFYRGVLCPKKKVNIRPYKCGEKLMM